MRLRPGNHRVFAPITMIVAIGSFACATFAADHPMSRSDAWRARQGQQQVVPAIEVYSRETFVDITVTDAHGHPVTGLKPSDFTILEDGKPMTPKSFAEHRAAPAPSAPFTAAPIPAKLELPPNVFTNLTPTPPSNGPLNILLLDTLNTPMQVQQIVALRMLDYVNRMPQGTQFAVFRLSIGFSILQGFTSDRELIRAALTNKKNTAESSPIADLDGMISKTELEGDAAAVRVEYTLSAMRQIARYVSGMPGRKNLIWFGGSFPLQFPPFSDPVVYPGAIMQGSVYDMTQEMASALDLLARSHVAIFSIDGRGVENFDRMPCEKSTTCKTDKENMHLSEHSTMEEMAERTGGKAFYNTNGLTEAVEEAVNLGSNFYTVTYTPVNQKLDTRFRKITVKVNRPGVKLTYREGYYAVDPGVDAHGKKVVPNANAMQTAMLRGALEPTQIVFKVKVAPTATTEVALPANNEIDAKRMKPPYKKLTVAYATDIHDIAFKPAGNGQVHADFEFAVMVYDGDGQVVNSSTVAFHPTLTTGRYQAMLRTGLNSQQEIAVPAKGEYTLRIAVHDLASDHVGAVEVPGSAILPETVPALAGK